MNYNYTFTAIGLILRVAYNRKLKNPTESWIETLYLNREQAKLLTYWFNVGNPDLFGNIAILHENLVPSIEHLLSKEVNFPSIYKYYFVTEPLIPVYPKIPAKNRVENPLILRLTLYD